MIPCRFPFQSLEYAITWNMGMLQGTDMELAGSAVLTKETPDFEDLPEAPEAPSRQTHRSKL